MLTTCRSYSTPPAVDAWPLPLLFFFASSCGAVVLVADGLNSWELLGTDRLGFGPADAALVPPGEEERPPEDCEDLPSAVLDWEEESRGLVGGPVPGTKGGRALPTSRPSEDAAEEDDAEESLPWVGLRQGSPYRSKFSVGNPTSLIQTASLHLPTVMLLRTR